MTKLYLARALRGFLCRVLHDACKLVNTLPSMASKHRATKWITKLKLTTMTATYYRPSIYYFWHGNSSHSWQAIVRFLLARIIEAVVWYYMFCGVLLDSLSLFFYTFWANAIIINQFNFYPRQYKNMRESKFTSPHHCKFKKVMPENTGHRT